MADFFEFDVDVDGKALKNKIDNLIDDKTMQQIHNLFAMLINPYVPMDEGPLSQSLEVTKDYVRYTQPYAHYQYMGEVYGPNYPGWEDGATPGWRSPAGKGSKHPTGRELGKQGHATLTPKWEFDGNYIKADPTKLIEWDFGYNTERHPNATHHWDKVAMQDQNIKKKFEEGVKNILLRRARDLYG